MKYQNRIMALPMLCMIIIVLSACCFDEQKNETSNVNPKVQSVETVSVTRGNLTPTVSAHTTIIPALDFVLCSSVEGTFEACSSAGNKITEGGVIGKVSEEEIKSPVDATILSIISSNESVPKNYPLATAKYTGFALNIEAENFLKILPENAALKAKFQVVDGVGPTEAIAVVVPVSENAESTLQCLIGKDIDVKPGQSATVVITAETRKDVLLGLLNHSYQGEFLYNGMSVSTLTDSQLSMLRASNIGFVFQNYSLIKHLRVWENIELVPNMWQVQSANIYWHMTNGLTTKQMYSALQDILKETIGGHLENTGRSDIGNAYDSVLAMLQLGLLVTSFLLLFVSVLGQINIGLSSLEQRTHELLIRRAIGASRANIVVSKSNYTATLPDGSTQTWRNTNTFLDQTSEYYNENVKGIKTGSLSNDYNLVVLYQQHGKEFLICSLGSQSDSSRYDDVNYILKTIDESDYLTK